MPVPVLIITEKQKEETAVMLENLLQGTPTCDAWVAATLRLTELLLSEGRLYIIAKEVEVEVLAEGVCYEELAVALTNAANTCDAGDHIAVRATLRYITKALARPASAAAGTSQVPYGDGNRVET